MLSDEPSDRTAFVEIRVAREVWCSLLWALACLGHCNFSCSEKWKCPKQKTICYAGGVKSLYKKSPFRYNRVVQALLQERKGDFMANKNNDLAHTKWMCKYHIVFTPKYRRKVIYNQLKADISDILKQLCSYKGVEILEDI